MHRIYSRPNVISTDIKLGKKITHMHTNWRTLSSSGMRPPCTRPLTMRTPSTGIKRSLPIAIEEIAPMGSDFHWFNGILRRARADPRQIKPSGTDAAPMKVATSIMKARGG